LHSNLQDFCFGEAARGNAWLSQNSPKEEFCSRSNPILPGSYVLSTDVTFRPCAGSLYDINMADVFCQDILDKSFAAVPPYIPNPKGRGFYGGLDKILYRRRL
jgi:hypothetical protein